MQYIKGFMQAALLLAAYTNRVALALRFECRWGLLASSRLCLGQPSEC